MFPASALPPVSFGHPGQSSDRLLRTSGPISPQAGNAEGPHRKVAGLLEGSGTEIFEFSFEKNWARAAGEQQGGGWNTWFSANIGRRLASTTPLALAQAERVPNTTRAFPPKLMGHWWG